MVRPPPGVSSGTRVPPMTVIRPRATARPSPRPSPCGASPDALEGGEDALLVGVGDPGTAVGDAQLHRVADAAGGDAHVGAARCAAGRSRRRWRAPGRAARGRCARAGGRGSSATSTRAGSEVVRTVPTTASSRSTAWWWGLTAPVSRRERSSRLPMSASSRSAESSMDSSSSASSSGGSSRPVWRSVDTPALMLASGVRRSCETAASRVVRAALSRASPAASPRRSHELLAAVQDRGMRRIGRDERAGPLRRRVGRRGAGARRRRPARRPPTRGRRAARIRATTSGRSRRSPAVARVARGRSARLGEHGRAHAEGVARLVEQHRQRAGLGEQVTAQGGERRGLPLGRDGLLGAPGRHVDRPS